MQLFCIVHSALCISLVFPVLAKTTLHKPISTGKDYYIVFPKAAWGNQNVGVLVNSPSAQTVSITPPSGIAVPAIFPKPRTTQYCRGEFNVVSTPGKVLPNVAARIQSPDPISVVGQFGIGGISGTYTALPVPSWGKEYYAVIAPEGQESSYNYYPIIYSVPMITIIGAYAGTQVTITPTAQTARTDRVGDMEGVPFTITLNAGDVYNVTTAGDPRAFQHMEKPCQADLSGTHVVSTKPVGVIVSQSHTSWPCGYNECGDYGVEWLPPVSNWDSVYLLTPSVNWNDSFRGEALRLVFCTNNTTLIADVFDTTLPKVIGTYNAGDVLDYPRPLSSDLLLSASHPFLPLIMTTKQGSCQAGTDGNGWTFGMVIPTGVHQWSDYVPFSTAIGSQSIANVCFKILDTAKLKLNGKRLMQEFPIVRHLGKSYAMVPLGINSGMYNEFTGDSGAAVGGTIFGFGTLRYSPGGNDTPRVQDPEVIKSFCHPMNIAALSNSLDDSIAPRISIASSCGHWDVTISDSSDAKSTGIYDIGFVKFGPTPDTSFNVQFTSVPSFAYGTMTIKCGIDVVNLAQPAQAAVRVRDGAGNEVDTVLVFLSEQVNTSYDTVSKGNVIAADSGRCVVTLHNPSSSARHYDSFRLKYGAAHHWKILSPPSGTPITIPPDDSVAITMQYTAPKDSFVVDADTLLMTTCREFAIATIIGRPKLPAINATCYDFGRMQIDTLSQQGASGSSIGRSILVWNIGTDTLHITGVSIVGTLSSPDSGYPMTDYTLGAADTPSVHSPLVLAPGRNTGISVTAHPHHSGPRPAYLHFNHDGKGVNDSGCLNITGVPPPILASNVDYGRHLYGTTADSFFIIRNTGRDTIRLPANAIRTGVGADSSAFLLFPYRDVNSHALVYYDTSVNHVFFPGDTALVPFRFMSKKTGYPYFVVSVNNSSDVLPYVQLSAQTVQPHITGLSACIPDAWRAGDTIPTTMMLHNSGDDVLNIENIEFGGARSAEWTITKVIVAGNGISITSPPWSVPLQGTSSTSKGEKAYVFLRWVPTVDSAPTTVVRVIGTDSLGRHSNDSVSSTFYKWNVFPYDTVMPIVNLPCLTGIEHQRAAAPTQNILWPNYPNPFSSSTTLSYTLGTSGHVVLRIVNALGETVSMLVNEHQSSGTYTVTARGAGLRAGMYFVELVSGGERVGRKMMVVE